MQRNEVHLDAEAKIVGPPNVRTNPRMVEVAVADRAAYRRGLVPLAVGMNAQGSNAAGIALDQLRHAVAGLRRDRVVQACAFEEALRRLVCETVFEIAVVVLVRLGMNDDGVI